MRIPRLPERMHTPAAALGLLVLALFSRGYEYNVRDQTVFLPYLQHMVLGVPFAPGDLLVENIQSVSTIHVFLTPLFRILPPVLKTPVAFEWFLLLLYAGSLWTVFWSLCAIMRRLTGSLAAGALACTALLLARGTQGALPGALEEYLSSRLLALAVDMGALLALVNGRFVAACGLAGFSMNLNPTMALPMCLLCFVSGSLPRQTRASRRVFTGGALVLLAAALPWFLAMRARGVTLHPLHASQDWTLVVERRFWFLNIAKWAIDDWVALLTPWIVLAMTEEGGADQAGAGPWRLLRMLLAITSTISACHIFFQASRPVPIVMSLQLIRSFIYVMMLMTMRLGALAARPGEGALRPLLATALFFAGAFSQDVPAVALALAFFLLPRLDQRPVVRLGVLVGACLLALAAARPGLLVASASHVYSGKPIFHAVVVLGAVAAVAHVGRGHPAAVPRVVLAVMVGLLVCVQPFLFVKARGQIPGLPYGQHLRGWIAIPGWRYRTTLERAAVWVRENTPPDAVCLVPFSARGFRGWSHRSPMYKWKDGCLSLFDEAYAAKWVRLYAQWDDEQGDRLPFGKLRDVRELPPHVQYLVAPVGIMDEWEPEALYVNEGYRVFRRTDQPRPLIPPGYEPRPDSGS